MTADPSYFDTVALFGYSFLIPVHAKLLATSAFIGLAIGFERALRKKVASLRTFSLICAGSCLFSIISMDAGGYSSGVIRYDITRVAAGIVTGIGFIGGGVIFKSADRVEGVTTAAMIWMTAALGMACGFNDIPLAICGFITYSVILALSWILHRVLHTHPEVESQTRERRPAGAARATAEHSVSSGSE